MSGWLFQRRRVRTPTILQMEAVECGAAALAIMLAHFGRWVPLEELRVACGVSRDGSKASNVAKAARSYGLDVKAQRAGLEFVTALPGPFIVFWAFNHFLVVEGFGRDRVYLNDPAIGPRTVDWDEFDKNFTGVVIRLHPGAHFQRGRRQEGLLGNLWRRTRGSREVVGLIGLFAFMIVLPALLLPALQKAFVDDVLGRAYTTWILPLVIGLAMTALLIGVLTWLQQKYLVMLQSKLAVQAGAQFFWHALRLPVSFFAQRYVGDVVSRLAGISRVSQLLAGPLATNMVNGLMIVFYAGVMALIDWQLTLVVLVLTAGNALAVAVVRRRRTDKSLALASQTAKANAAGMGGIQAIETLKATGTEGDFFQTWAGYHANQVNAKQSLDSYGRRLDAVPTFLKQVTIAAILVVGGLMILEGQLTVGGLVAFQTLAGLFFSPVQDLVGFGGRLQEIKADLARLDDLQRYRLDSSWTSEQAHLAESPPPAAAGEGMALTVRGLRFAYSPLDPPFIDGFDLVLEPGQRVALVGGSGSGKSTLAKLIMGLYPPDAGEILFDGRRAIDIPREVFVDQTAYVEQDTELFEGSVFDNLTLWDETVAQADVVQAAKDARIHAVVAARPGGYRSPVTERGNFSGGQRQRLNIARALVRRPRLLVLDEATSALDPVTEMEIYEALARRGCTCLIIAHRLSAIRDSDEILVLERGRVVERGTHKELFAAGDHYYRLVGTGEG